MNEIIRAPGKGSETVNLVDAKRDLDIGILNRVSGLVGEIPGSVFVLTGSYSVEALTRTLLLHNDMDTNVFTRDLAQNLPKIDSLLGKWDDVALYKRSDDRLEYDVLSEGGLISPRRLELQFIEFINSEERDNLLRLTLGGKEGGFFSVPVTRAGLLDSKGKESVFRVKSLPFAIATWVIRLSGSVKNPKRSVRESDLDHLRLLVSGNFKKTDVLTEMGHHPQMDKLASAPEMFDEAMRRLKA